MEITMIALLTTIALISIIWGCISYAIEEGIKQADAIDALEEEMERDALP
jgi:phosphotransferase system  glucose/maltose/N-acetylglucosamine-specific IIC component